MTDANSIAAVMSCTHPIICVGPLHIGMTVNQTTSSASVESESPVGTQSHGAERTGYSELVTGYIAFRSARKDSIWSMTGVWLIAKMISAKGSPGLAPRVVAAICRDLCVENHICLTHRFQDGAQVLVVSISIKEPWVLKRGSQNIT